MSDPIDKHLDKAFASLDDVPARVSRALSGHERMFAYQGRALGRIGPAEEAGEHATALLHRRIRRVAPVLVEEGIQQVHPTRPRELLEAFEVQMLQRQ
jgi:hypothetical protein